MTRKQLPFFAAFIVLLFGAMACACLGSGVGVPGFQATANAAFTQASSGAATAGAQGNTLAATAAVEATNAAATASAAGGSSAQATPTKASGGTTSEATATTASSGGGGGGSANGGPSDVPVVKGDNTILLINQQLVSYQTKVSFADTVKFYKGAMPENGWKEDTATSVETQNADVLAYTKDNRKAQVSITADPNSGQTVVLITIQ
jgi:hypothetical protein